MCILRCKERGSGMWWSGSAGQGGGHPGCRASLPLPVPNKTRIISTLQVVVFAIHWHESAMDIRVFPILNPPPTSLPTSSLWVIPVHQPWGSHITLWTWTLPPWFYCAHSQFCLYFPILLLNSCHLCTSWTGVQFTLYLLLFCNSMLLIKISPYYCN